MPVRVASWHENCVNGREPEACTPDTADRPLSLEPK
jgi:hypothetical protein